MYYTSRCTKLFYILYRCFGIGAFLGASRLSLCASNLLVFSRNVCIASSKRTEFLHQDKAPQTSAYFLTPTYQNAKILTIFQISYFLNVVLCENGQKKREKQLAEFYPNWALGRN